MEALQQVLILAASMKNYDTELKTILGFYNNEKSHDFDGDILKTQLQIFSKNFPLSRLLLKITSKRLIRNDFMTGSNLYSRKIPEFQAEGLGFQNFAWLGSNPSYAPDILHITSFMSRTDGARSSHFLRALLADTINALMDVP